MCRIFIDAQQARNELSRYEMEKLNPAQCGQRLVQGTISMAAMPGNVLWMRAPLVSHGGVQMLFKVQISCKAVY